MDESLDTTVDQIVLPGKKLGDVLKEITDNQTAGFARIEKALEDKATTKDIERLRQEHAEFKLTTNRRLTALEQYNHDKEVSDKAVATHKVERGLSRKAKWGIASGAIVGGGTLAMAIAAVLGLH